MSPIGIANSLWGLTQSSRTAGTQPTGNAQSGQGTDFSSSLAVRMATFQAQSVSSLLGSVLNGDPTQASTNFDFLGNPTGTPSGTASDLFSLLGLPANAQGLSASGRNQSLFDPESGYRMMSEINRRDVNYKAQFAELSAMKDGVAAMQQAGQALGSVDAGTDNEAIKSQLQTFVGQYNDWIARFDSTVQSGGVLAGTQAAEVSLHELEQTVENPFNGAQDGLHGLRDLGFTIDPTTDLATLDPAKLDAALASNKQGVVDTIDQFSANFAKSAELLNSANNFIPNRLDNLNRAIDYITKNEASLQQEFGLGDAPKPSAYVAKALAAYNRMNPSQSA